MRSIRLTQMLLAAIAGLGLAIVLGMSTAAAQGPVPYVSDEGQEQGEVGSGGAVAPEPATEVLSSSASPSSAALPLTGGEAFTIALAGATILVLGVGAVAVSRRTVQA